MTWQNVEELGSVVHGKREDQPIRLSTSKRRLGGGSGGGPIAQSYGREAREHMCFEQCVRREAWRRNKALNGSEDSQRRGRVSLCQADCRPAQVDAHARVVFD